MTKYEELSLAMSKVKLELENLERAVLAVKNSELGESRDSYSTKLVDYWDQNAPKKTEWNCKGYLGKK